MLGQELTQKILIPTLALLTSHGFWEISGFRSLLNVVERAACPFSPSNHPEAHFHPPRTVISLLKAPRRGVSGKLCEISMICATTA